MDIAHKTDTPERSEAEQVAFFDALMEGWHAAAERAGRASVYLDFAGTLVELAFAGDRLAPLLLPALAHLVTAPARAADVVFHLWESASSGVPAVPPPCGRDGFTERGDIWGMTSARVRTAFHWHEFSVNAMDLARKRGVFWVASAEHLPYWSKASPLRTLFHWWAEATGAQLLHAAAVGGPDGAVLITGRGGVGKSSTALASLAAGMHYAGDDYVVVRLDPEPRVYSLYSTAKLDGSQMERFPALRAQVTNERALASEKAVLHLLPAFAPQVARSLPLRAIVTPAFADRLDTAVGPASAAALQRAAAFTTMSQLPGAGRQTHRFVDRLIAALPGFTLLLGRDRARVPDALRALLALGDAERRAMAAGAGGAAAPAPAGRRPARPVVSVVIPVFNGVPFLERCVRSVLAQDYAPLEIVVVDDGSTDDVETAVRALPVDVRFVRQSNAGPAAARNRGLREASGDLVAFLDVDDYWPAGNLTALAARLAEHPDAVAVHGAAQVVRAGEHGAPDAYLGGPGDAFPYYVGAGLYRREAFARVGPFDAELRFGEDTDWFRRARECRAPIVYVDEVCLFVRRHAGNMTRGKTLVEVSTLRVFKKALDRRRAEAPAGGWPPNAGAVATAAGAGRGPAA